MSSRSQDGGVTSDLHGTDGRAVCLEISKSPSQRHWSTELCTSPSPRLFMRSTGFHVSSKVRESERAREREWEGKKQKLAEETKASRCFLFSFPHWETCTTWVYTQTLKQNTQANLEQFKTIKAHQYPFVILGVGAADKTSQLLLETSYTVLKISSLPHFAPACECGSPKRARDTSWT